MELGPEVWIPAASGGAVVSIALGWLLRSLRGRTANRRLEATRSLLITAEQERDDAVRASLVQLETISTLRAELDGAVSGVSHIDTPAVSTGDASAPAPPAMLPLRDVMGLEAEIATLRVLAGRARALEARVAELESELVIDLRDSVSHPAR